MSEQEHWIEALSRHTLGSLFVFRPDDYRKGNATREPCDLAWFANDCLVVMCMYRGSSRDFSSAEQHNIKQLRGGLRAWVSGRPISGSNDSWSFNVAEAEVKHVVALSIIGGNNAGGRRLDLDDVNLGRKVRLAATLPEQTVELFAQKGGSMRDLIGVLASLPDSKIDPAGCDDIVVEAHSVAFTRARADASGHLIDDDLRRNTVRLVTDWKRMVIQQPSQEMVTIIASLCDLDWYAKLVLIRTAYFSIEKCSGAGGDSSKGELHVLRFEPYTICLSIVGDSLEPWTAMKHADDTLSLREATSEYPALLVQVRLRPHASQVLVGNPRTGPSATSTLIESLYRPPLMGADQVV